MGRKLFKGDHLKTVNQFATFLMRKIAPSVGDPLVYLGKDRFLFRILLPVLGLLGCVLPSLDALEVCFITAVETRIVDLLTCRKGGKRDQPNIHANNLNFLEGNIVKRIVDAWPWISVTGSIIIGGEALLLLLLLRRCKKREEED